MAFHQGSGSPPNVEVAVQEYLAMRAEMTETIRLELNLVLTALLVVAGAAAAAGTNLAGIGPAGAGLLLQLAAAFAFLVLGIAVSLANGFLIIEEYVTVSAQQLAAVAATTQLPNLFSFQRRIHDFTRSRARDDLLANVVAYGAPGAVAGIALAIAIALSVAGFVLPGAGSLEPWGKILGLVDLSLGIIAAVHLWFSARRAQSWWRTLGYDKPIG